MPVWSHRILGRSLKTGGHWSQVVSIDWLRIVTSKLAKVAMWCPWLLYTVPWFLHRGFTEYSYAGLTTYLSNDKLPNCNSILGYCVFYLIFIKWYFVCKCRKQKFILSQEYCTALHICNIYLLQTECIYHHIHISLANEIVMPLLQAPRNTKQ